MARPFCALGIFTVCFVPVLAATGDSDQANIPGGFVPKKSLSYIALSLYAFSALIHWIHFFMVPPRRSFIITLPLGMTAMATGFILRIVYSNPPYSLGKYIGMDLFILLSPCLFLATDYMLLSHLARSFDEEVSDRCLLIRHSRVTKIFVWSDIITFLLQSGGGGMTASKNNLSLVNVGNKIALVGLTLQAVSFGLFTIVLIVFAYRVSKLFPELWRPKKSPPVQGLLAATYRRLANHRLPHVRDMRWHSRSICFPYR
ncbi:hypothetical protein MSAN_00333100 [Mycena sanguinolenta]|uniref:RTA1-domain-containing protein n=1 Tax=Mycena sanguinolenta TaxID=230812 RepID=A0A8H7DIH9_9AGAR|nr:hypothetical protein MSAN_00333100 [Mycena sanguinolenta]